MSEYFIYDWADRRQNRQLRELGDSLSRARSETSGLRSKLRQVTGSLESRLDKLASAFDAFVELSDLRVELVAFAEAVKVRRHAAAVLSASRLGESSLPAPPDVSGYWLGPAVQALQAMASGADAGATAHIAEALERERDRAALFFCLTMPALGRGEAAAEWLDDAFGAVDAEVQVTKAQRRLWVVAAHGGFGPAGRDIVVGKLRAAVPDPMSGGWLDRIAPASGDTELLTEAPEAAEQLAAADRLTRLRTACQRLAAPNDTVKPGDAEQLDDAALQDGAADVRELLGLLVSEGSPPERELISRAAELRQIIAPEGTTLAPNPSTGERFRGRLLSDLAGQDAVLSGLAFRSTAPAIDVVARALAAKASASPVQQVTTRIGSDNITFRPAGPSPESMGAAERRIAGSVRVEKGSRAAAYVLLGVGAVFLLLGFVNWGFALLGLVLAVAGGVQLLYRIRGDREAAEYAGKRVSDRLQELRTRAGKVSESLAAYSGAAAERKATAAADLEAITMTTSARPLDLNQA
ncbi:hypothetical protein [Flindersiella endophytica]